MQLSNKLAPYGTGSGLQNWHFCQVQSHVRHTRTNINNPAGSNSDTAPYSLRISGQLSAPIVNGGGHFENGRISNFEGLVTLTLDRVILHTVMHHSSTSTYMPNVIEIKETSCGRTDGRTDAFHDLNIQGQPCCTEPVTHTTYIDWVSSYYQRPVQTQITSIPHRFHSHPAHSRGNPTTFSRPSPRKSRDFLSIDQEHHDIAF